MNLFTAIKETLTARQIAEAYGIKVGRSALARCPFHQDRRPSLKLDQRFHCFGCGADGDAVDFAARLFSLPARAAAEKLAEDFGIDYDRSEFCAPNVPGKDPTATHTPETTPAQFAAMLAKYQQLLRRWAGQYAPQRPGELWHPRFVEALQNREHAAYLLEELDLGTPEEGRTLTKDYRNEVRKLEQHLRICELHSGGAAEAFRQGKEREDPQHGEKLPADFSA